MRPEDIWRLEPDYEAAYEAKVKIGTRVAADSSVAIVSIARNAMPHLTNTLPLVEELAGRFRRASYYVYENDSTDETARVLDDFAALRQWVCVEHDTLGGEDLRGFEPERTLRLAGCRNRCRDWVEDNPGEFVVVLDVDPHGGFSVDGVLNSVGWIADLTGQSRMPAEAGGMASYSLFVRKDGNDFAIAGYDAWAARMNHWEDRRDRAGGMQWFHLFLPPVGSPPIQMNSAFGGLAVYTRRAFLSSRYSGTGTNGQPDCEHVAFHHGMRQKGYQMFLNPGSRYIAILP